MKKILNLCSPNKGTVKSIQKKMRALQEKLSEKKQVANIVGDYSTSF